MRKSVCIVSFSNIARDARVLRQIEALSEAYEVRVVGFGDPENVPRSRAEIEWHLMPEHPPQELPGHHFRQRYAISLARQFQVLPERAKFLVYGRLYWRRPHYREALSVATGRRSDLYVVNDWNALPIGAVAKKTFGARLVFDAHEYAPLEFEHDELWLATKGPLRATMLRRYAHLVDGSMTVAPRLAERLKRELGVDPIVVLNAPKLEPLSDRSTRIDDVRLLHHGVASRDRKIENMIDAVSLADPRFSLDLMLLGSDPQYMKQLKERARIGAPGRIRFLSAVRPESIVHTIANYDIGFCLLYPSTYNIDISLPNKLFDYVVAGLAVCVGPSLSMAQFVQEHGVGFVTPSYDPRDVAAALNNLDAEQIGRMRLASARAAKVFNGNVEMQKVRDICARLLETAPS